MYVYTYVLARATVLLSRSFVCLSAGHVTACASNSATQPVVRVPFSWAIVSDGVWQLVGLRS